MSQPLLDIRDLSIAYRSPDGDTRAVRGVDLALHPGSKPGITVDSIRLKLDKVKFIPKDSMYQLTVDELALRFRTSFPATPPAPAPLHVETGYPEQWRAAGGLALFATASWQEVMAGRIEGEPHWFWTEAPQTPPTRRGRNARSVLTIECLGWFMALSRLGSRRSTGVLNSRRFS